MVRVDIRRKRERERERGRKGGRKEGRKEGSTKEKGPQETNFRDISLTKLVIDVPFVRR